MKMKFPEHKVIYDFVKPKKMPDYSKIKTCSKQSSDLPISSATIYCDNDPPSKTLESLDWGACRELKRLNTKGDWHHIMYLDTLPNIYFSNLAAINSKPISIDLCTSDLSEFHRARVMDCVPLVDYVFLSDNEMCLWNLNDMYPKKGIILHHSRGSTFIDSNTREEVYGQCHEIVKGINVLGAGDFFAAAVICLLQTQENVTSELLNRAHELTSEYLKVHNGYQFSNSNRG